jgi:hypothetical protein
MSRRSFETRGGCLDGGLHAGVLCLPTRLNMLQSEGGFESRLKNGCDPKSIYCISLAKSAEGKALHLLQ